MSDTMMRHLLGSEKALVHDPGPKGESGEGDAALVMHVKERARAWVESQAGGGDEYGL